MSTLTIIPLSQCYPAEFCIANEPSEPFILEVCDDHPRLPTCKQGSRCSSTWIENVAMKCHCQRYAGDNKTPE